VGVELFGVSISGIVKDAMADGLPAIRLLKEQVGVVDEASPTEEPPVSYRSVPCRGFEDSSEDTRRNGTQVQQTGRLVLIIGDTLPRGVVPEPGDRIQILGETLEIVGEGVSSDPARATYLCACT
jgi:hypothetical protein